MRPAVNFFDVIEDQYHYARGVLLARLSFSGRVMFRSSPRGVFDSPGSTRARRLLMFAVQSQLLAPLSAQPSAQQTKGKT